eukprot:PhF_6_TR15872/c0_g1_i1/m.24466
MDNIEISKAGHADASKKSKDAQERLNAVILRMGNISNDPVFLKQFEEAYKQLEDAQEGHSDSLKRFINVSSSQDERAMRREENANDVCNGRLCNVLKCRLGAVKKTAKTQQSTAEQLY